jgi:ubiquinone/menaquinone biosynthesis C-methylase UbiE
LSETTHERDSVFHDQWAASVDLVATAVELGRLHGVGVDGIVAPGEELPVPANHYDFVYAANTLHHVTDREKLLQHIQRALKPGGAVLLWDPLAAMDCVLARVPLIRRLAWNTVIWGNKPLPTPV